MKFSKLEGEVSAKMESVNRIHVYIFAKFCSSYVNCLQR